MTAQTVQIILQAGFAGILLYVLWSQGVERKRESEARLVESREELTARLAHWTEETAMLRGIRESLVRMEPLPAEVARLGRRIERVAQAVGAETTSVSPIPTAPSRGGE